MLLVSEIKEIFEDSYCSYGSPRVTAELKSKGFNVSKPRVARLMANELVARRPRKFKVTTDSKHNYPIVPNLLDGNFKVEQSNQVWVSDITYIRTHQGWLYLTVIIDLFDRKVIGWAMSSDLTAQNTSITAFRMALRNTDLSKNNNLIFHSDRGVHYACGTFTNIMNHYKITRSMSRKGNCWDNVWLKASLKH